MSTSHHAADATPHRGPRAGRTFDSEWLGSIERRFWSKVDRQNAESCWLWLASTSTGYGQIRHRGKVVYAHRIAYELLVGPIPKGLTLDHLCRNPACCNPSHLEPVTHRENLLRGEGFSARNARKTRCVNGHEFDEQNTGKRATGRYCITCANKRTALARS